MSEQSARNHSHPAEAGLGAVAGHTGAGPRTYLVVAAFLLAITVMEV